MNNNLVTSYKLVRFKKPMQITLYGTDESGNDLIGFNNYDPVTDDDLAVTIEPSEHNMSVLHLPYTKNKVRTSPIRNEDFEVVGETKHILMTKYDEGYSPKLSIHLHRFLVAEMESFENMPSIDQSETVCNIGWAVDAIEQMPDDIFAEEIEIANDPAHIKAIKADLKEELSNLVEYRGQDTLLGDLNLEPIEAGNTEFAA